MRTALLVLVLALAACGKKKAPASPSNDATQAAPTDDEKSNEEKSVTAPDEQEDGMKSSDPCEGGE